MNLCLVFMSSMRNLYPLKTSKQIETILNYGAYISVLPIREMALIVVIEHTLVHDTTYCKNQTSVPKKSDCFLFGSKIEPNLIKSMWLVGYRF